MPVSLVKPPSYLTTAKLTKDLSDPLPGPRRVAEAMLTVAPEERSIKFTAATIFHNTTPGWRLTAACRLMAQESLAYSERIVNEERARAQAERALRRTGGVYSNAVITSHGEVRIPDPTTMMIGGV